ncbi:MAG: Mur ligase family protein, partial [Candidatus Wenzhouxiangella sp. M2_3B_020]
MRLADLNAGRTLVLGFGREARSLERVARARAPGADVVVYADRRPDEPPAEWALAVDPVAAWAAPPARVLRSPGVPLHHPLVQRARAEDIPVTCITSLWFGERPDARVVAVTGSKGKSTTAALIGHLLEAAGERVALGGNIGIPMLDLLDASPDWFVVELSSYQLADLAGHAAVGVITRLFPEHQDWHGGVAPYYAAKLRLGELLDGGPLFFNAADPVLADALNGRAGLCPVNRPSSLHAGSDGLWRGNERIMSADAWALQGRHNLDNAALALATVESLIGRIEDASSMLASFRSLPHRLSRVPAAGATRWINDSIATTPHA